jgi:hypothetical protein
VKFVNALIKNGIVVHRATSMFEVAGKTYPADSFVVKAAQAFRPHILDMFEPQDHPDDFQYAGGPPVPPYDSAGWTLAFQMGIQFDRILDGFEGPFQRIDGLAKPPAGTVSQPETAVGFLLSHGVNDAFIATNRLLRDGEHVCWLKSNLQAGGKTYPAGTIYIEKRQDTVPKLQRLAQDVGLVFDPVTEQPACEAIALSQPRIGLWDSYGGSMPSGWVRWMLEKFEFDFQVVYAPELDQGDLASRYDVLIFVGAGIPGAAGAPSGTGRQRSARLPDPESVPIEYHERLGRITVEKTIPQLKQFVEQGGSIVAIGNASAAITRNFGLPLANALVERKEDGTEQPLPSSKFYVPGSILRMCVDTTNPLAYGLPDHVDVYYQNSSLLRLRPDSVLNGVKPVAWFDSDAPLRSGWAYGQQYLRDGITAVEARVGKGSLVLVGPEVTFRAQPHGTFKLLFNSIYYGANRTR